MSGHREGSTQDLRLDYDYGSEDLKIPLNIVFPNLLNIIIAFMYFSYSGVFLEVYNGISNYCIYLHIEVLKFSVFHFMPLVSCFLILMIFKNLI